MAKQGIDTSIDEVIEKMDLEERKADSSIKGYFFQIHLTLNRILNSDLEDTKYYIEKIEDILEREDLVKEDGKINIIQVKHHETMTTDSKYTEPLLYFYMNFLVAKNYGKTNLFKFTLIKYDYSGEKDVNRIIRAGLESKAVKNLELQEKITKLIAEIKIDNRELEEEFISCCEIITSLDLKSIKEKNVQIIHDFFNDDKMKSSLAENFYSWAWTYVINNFTQEDFYLTKRNLLDLFTEKIDEIQNFVVDQRWVIMEEALSELGDSIKLIGTDITAIKDGVTSLQKVSEVTINKNITQFISRLIDDLKEEINNDYFEEENDSIEFLSDELLNLVDEIKAIILSNIEESDEKKYYFLVSLSPESINKEEFLTDRLKYFFKQEYNIDSFLRRLVKIYFHKKHIEKTVNDSSELFEFVGNGLWMLKAKENDKDYYVNLLGGHDKSSKASGLNTLMKKYIYSYDNNYPDLILFKGKKKGEISKIDISRGESNNIGIMRRRIDRKKKDLHLKCITCLKDDDFNDYSDCANIFKFGCELGVWKV